MSQMRRNTCTMLTYFVAPWHSVINLRVIDRGSLVNLHRLCNDMESRREPRNVFPPNLLESLSFGLGQVFHQSIMKPSVRKDLIKDL